MTNRLPSPPPNLARKVPQGVRPLMRQVFKSSSDGLPGAGPGSVPPVPHAATRTESSNHVKSRARITNTSNHT